MWTATPPRGTRMWVPTKLALLAERRPAGPSCSDVARGQLVAAHRGVGVERAGAALDVDPAVAARRAGVARDRVERFLALVQVGGERLQARRALLEVERQQRRHAGARARTASASPKSISSAWAWWIALPSMALASAAPARLPTQRSAIRLCRIERSDMARALRVQGWYFQAPFSILTITRARWSRPRWSVGDMLKTPCAPCTSRAVSSASRSAARNSGVPGLRLLQRLGRGDCHQPAGVPGVGAEGRDRALAVRRLVLGDVVERARPHRVVRRQLRRHQHRARRQVGAVDVLAADAQEVVVGDAVRLVVLAGVAALLQRSLRQHGRRARGGDQDRVGLGGDELQHLAGDRGVGARIALAGDDRSVP